VSTQTAPIVLKIINTDCGWYFYVSLLNKAAEYASLHIRFFDGHLALVVMLGF